jgi:lipoprotein-releasing system permease protein
VLTVRAAGWWLVATIGDVYHAVLTRRYLTSKVMPLLASLAVMLCTAMVLITWSVMGGFLNMLLISGRTLVGDVTIIWPTSGFAHYQDLIRRLEADKDYVAAASPVLETFGLVQLPDNRQEGVSIKGIDPASYARVVAFDQSLYWQPRTEPLPRDVKREDPRLSEKERALLEGATRDGLAMFKVDPATGKPRPAAVPGIEMSGFSLRHPAQFYTPRTRGQPNPDGTITWKRAFMPEENITIVVLPVTREGRLMEQVSRVFPVANEFRTGVFEIDRKQVLVELGALQQMLKMDEAVRVRSGASIDVHRIDQAPGGREAFPEVPTEGLEPARVTHVIVKAAPGLSADALRERVIAVYRAFEADHPKQVPPTEDLVASNLIATWEQSNATLIGAVKKETVLVLSLLTFISVTASFLILAIFWSMVAEKTKDIGILRAIGASRMGVAWLWLRYGLAIGVLGSGLGGALAWVIVTNINAIHEWLGQTLGVYVWDPRVYYFTLIPSQVEPWKAALVLSAGLLFSVMGALIPAIRAARMEPVRALRFE